MMPQEVRDHSGEVDIMGLPGGSVVKNANAGNTGSILGWGRSPGEENDNLLQYSCLENLMGRGVWWATDHGIAKESDTTYRLNDLGWWLPRDQYLSLG